ncbi:autotransporter outer membrane beta-barrel domain-containing protein [Pseudomonas hamedanensis]|uniref:Autotransporter outer membrane beta-barrel domain-containing protein n=1 Tax=Pseudomonas hamedanensis TaxID=2745504 RepID=A0A9E6P3E3_9PSED|nr:autotransporter outer membrane beta-barrel domain-containing protein [Pseudomonas hamedanensis]QXI19359.1 autotransporter outer membrane beta-barrel domain-containing protein [Pseudomonas hamedanensis]
MNMLDVSHVRAFSARSGVMLCLPAVFFFANFAHSATIVDNTTLNIDSSTAPTDYLVRNKGVLNASDANTRSITAQSGSSLSINGSTIVGNDGGDGVTVTSSRASIDRTTVTSDEIGLAVNRSSVAAGGATVTVSDSQISGQLIGSQVTGLSSLSLTNTQVMGAASDGIGVNILGGEVSASARTTITGQATGVRMVNDALNVGSRTLSLDNSTVQGIGGSAILVDRGTEATINVLDGSSLVAGNGRLLDVQGSSIASLTVANSTLNGNVNVADNSTANLLFDRGEITGNVLVDGSSTANVTLENNSQLTGRLDNVEGVNINSNSNWTLTGNDSIGAMRMDGGRVTFGAADAPDTYYQLNVGALAGTGTFLMKGNFASGEHDFLNVTGASAGNFALAVAASGLDAASPQALTLVRTATTDSANFALAGEQRVDVGTWSYGLASREIEGGAKEWFLDPTTEVISPGARSVLALFNTALTVWYGDMGPLRNRLDELHFNGDRSGGWIRTYGNKYNVADNSGVGYQQTQQGLSLGADARLGESDVLVGVLAGTSESDLDLKNGTSGTVKSYYFGPYFTWFDSAKSYYLDGVLKFNRYRNESKVGLSDGSRAKGNYDNWGVGGSVEFGRQFTWADGYFVQPFTQWSAVQIQDKRYTLDNDMRADGDRTRSLLGKAGATFGRNFTVGNGTVVRPYVRAAIAHEFATNNEVKVNDNVFNNDLSGSRAEFGAGLAVAMSEKWQVRADFDYSRGEHIEKPYGVNLGVWYRW